MVSVMLDKTGLDYINDRIRNTIREIPFKDLLFVHFIAICVINLVLNCIFISLLILVPDVWASQ